jgi:hypothetical protein
MTTAIPAVEQPTPAATSGWVWTGAEWAWCESGWLWTGSAWVWGGQYPQAKEQHAQAQQQHSPYAEEPPRRGKGGLIAAIVGGGAFVVVLAVAATLVTSLLTGTVTSANGTWRIGDSGGSGSSDSSDSGESADTDAKGRPTITSREGWYDLQYRAESVYEEYQDALDDDSIMRFVPNNPKGIAYAKGFVSTLLDQKQKVDKWGGDDDTKPLSGDAATLDAKIKDAKTTIVDVEKRFLAGEALGVPVHLTTESGERIDSDGTTGIVDPDAEEFARGFGGQLGADGTYKDAVAELADHFGMAIDYTLSNVGPYCTSPSGDEIKYLIAVYCGGDPHTIYVNQDYGWYGENIASTHFVNDIKHEISHHLIDIACNTSRPSITGAANEGVTSSYAVLFLGADRDSLQHDADSPFPEYMMTEQTDALARGIHDEKRCKV